MILKTNLHLHANDDPEDNLEFSFIAALDEAKRLGIGCVALTCHNAYIDKPEYHAAAKERGILYIPGIELSVERKHVVILNADKSVEKIASFVQLARYKAEHPECFILAPHPYFKTVFCLGDKLEQHKEIFDAIECSWFYSKHFDMNKEAAAFAKENNLPYVATSDLHELRFMDTSYANVEVDQVSIPAVFAALRAGKFTNTTSPRKLFRELIPNFIYLVLL
ncbi:MAG TPA: PHP domain-containing protein [Candidatus Paceibacterota bacterium]|nr:PHP domain-containing protein [Candidatus Paceibacterota bacterium]